MKLELKHLAPYLPYGLKVHESFSNRIGELRSLNINGKVNVLHKVIWCFEIEEIKPILRPLSDLTKELYQHEILIRWGGGLSEKAKVKWLNDITDEIKLTAYNALRYDFVELLFEHHFDVFGLIPQGLAISINTLNQPPCNDK